MSDLAAVVTSVRMGWRLSTAATYGRCASEVGRDIAFRVMGNVDGVQVPVDN